MRTARFRTASGIRMCSARIVRPLLAHAEAGAEAALKAISADSSLSRGTRAEASYHLATLAHDAGNAAEVGRLLAEMNKIDANGVWAQRATTLLSTKSGL